MAESQSSASRQSKLPLAFNQSHLPWMSGNPSGTSTIAASQPPSPATVSSLPAANPPLPSAHITNIPNEILINITETLHPTAVSCFSVTCSKMYTFFQEQSLTTCMPSLTAVIPYEPLGRSQNESTHGAGNNHPKQLWELLEVYMQPRLWVGYYGLDKFVNMRLYQEVRNDYWKLYPQRPFSTEEPSTWLREGSDAVNVRGTVRELEENLRQHRFDMEMLCLGTVGFGIGGPSFQQDLGVQPPRSWRDLVHSLDTEAMHRLSLEERAPAE